MNRSVLPFCLGIAALSLLVVSPSIAQVGACCFADCTCVETTEEDCYALGGAVWLGEGTVCVPDPCSCPPGVCCTPDGLCYWITEPDCLAMGGEFDHMGTCDPNPCPQIGACCYVDGICVLMTFEECLALEPEGACLWVYADTCDPNPCPNCPSIACCLPDGTCHVYCEYGACEAEGGEVLGCFCENHPCPRIGACCLAGGYCEEITPTDCALQGGEYMGHEIPCDPNPCVTSGVPEISTEQVTWGRIKSRYK